jgi:hypothetical protein
MAPSRNAQVRIKKARRGILALKLREAGLSYTQIGERMNVSVPRAWKLVSQEFDRLLERRTEKASAVTRLELQRLDTLHKAIWKKAKGGDLNSIDRLLKIAERRAALLGLDIKRHEVKVEQSYEINVSARIDEYTAELDRQLGARPLALPGDPAGNDTGEPVDQTSTDVEAIVVPGL